MNHEYTYMYCTAYELVQSLYLIMQLTYFTISRIFNNTVLSLVSTIVLMKR